MPELVEDPSAGVRSIRINRLQSEKLVSNEISTSKYNLVTFLPRFLMEQFRRYANVFFLIIAVLQQIPNVSPTGRYTTAVPLLCILSVSAIKEVFEDFVRGGGGGGGGRAAALQKRAQADRRENRRRVTVLRGGAWCSERWMDLRPGDLVKLANGDAFPADLLLLASSEPQAMAYIETSNLDGETNLKLRQGLPVTAALLNHDHLMAVEGTVECELPNRHLYEFHGQLRLHNEDAVPLGPNQVLLRGSRLKNTNWVFGLVIYTGPDTKLMKNSRKAPLKRSNVDVVTNYQILVLFAALIVIALISAIFAQVWDDGNLTAAWYMGLSSAMGTTNFGRNFLTFLILYNNLIPISLQVTLEVVRFLQAFYINWDDDMYDARTDTRAMARTSNLNEELGQVKYLLTDKTGTLTRNIMTFKKCSVAGVVYGSEQGGQFDDRALVDNMNSRHVTAPVIRHFLTLMAVCHTVVPERDAHGRTTYQTSSPDEGALVRGARALGFEFHTRTPDSVVVNVQGADEVFQVLNVLEFSSARKRMGVIVRGADGNLKLFVKGADSVIFERLAERQLYREVTLRHMEEFANLGYRTLCFATADLDEQQYAEWRRGFYEASIAIDDREQKLADEAEKIEQVQNLTLLGASGIEDKLQPGVPETIAALLKADIKVWMLTGDKRETAINIGHACKLISPNMPLMIVEKSSAEATRDTVRRYLDDLGPQYAEQENDLALVLDGFSLRHALADDTRADLMALAASCRVVICCRTSPMQKAEVVELVKQSVGAITLAIGDGANDVAMLQAAHVGVGITGQEGLQAAAASDYTIGQFRFLAKLLFVHGAWNFHRTVKLILYSFYKNICLYIIELWFAIYSAWSGQPLFERWSIGLFNVIFTMAPPFAIGLFDRTASADTMLKYPLLYRLSQDRRAFSVQVFSVWILSALFHSVLLYFLSMGAFGPVAWSHGRTGGWLMFGNCVYTCSHVAIWGSIASWFVFVAVYSHVWPLLPIGPEMAGMARLMLTSGLFWLGLLLIPVAAVVTDLVYKVVRRSVFKTIADEVRELELSRVDPALIIPKLTRRRVAWEAATGAYGAVRAVAGTDSVRFVRGGPVDGVVVGAPSAAERARLSETARLLRNVFRRSTSGTTLAQEAQHGYAFSQEEHGAVSQGDLVRAYDSTRAKPKGL